MVVPCPLCNRSYPHFASSLHMSMSQLWNDSIQKSKTKGKNKKKKEIAGQKPRTRQCSLVTTSELLDALDANDTEGCRSFRFTGLTPTLPPSFFRLFVNIRFLSLNSVGLTVLPPQIIELQNLQTLDLRNNSLTYLPSQIAQLSNLNQLRMSNYRDGKTRLSKRYNPQQGQASCSRGPMEGCNATDADKNHWLTTLEAAADSGCGGKVQDSTIVPSIPTLSQLCARIILSSIPTTKSEDPDTLSWEDLEPLYKTGKFEETDSDILRSLPFPSHFLPTTIPIDICSLCSEIVLPIHAEMFKIQDIALCRIRLRYVFCSRKCMAEILRRWDVERHEEEERRRLRSRRFELKDSASEADIQTTI